MQEVVLKMERKSGHITVFEIVWDDETETVCYFAMFNTLRNKTL